MAYNTKGVIKDKDGNPISQYFNPVTDEYEAVEGSNGANKVVVYNSDGTENNVSLIPILDKLNQLTGSVIDEETRKTNELGRKSSEVIRVSNEDVRISSEIDRELEEGTRVLNEGIREANEVNREQNKIIVDGWIANPSQFNGKDIEYNWQGTELGIRIAGTPTYEYVNLKGETGSIDSLDATHIQSALGFLPINYVAGTNVIIDGNVINASGNVDSVNGKTGIVELSKTDVGLGNVLDVKQASKVEFDTLNSNFSTHLADYVNHKINYENYKNDLRNYSTYKSLPDVNGIFTQLEYKRPDDTLIMKSVLSGGISPEYATRTETQYAQNGIDIVDVKIYSIVYVEGKVTSEVLQ